MNLTFSLARSEIINCTRQNNNEFKLDSVHVTTCLLRNLVAFLEPLLLMMSLQWQRVCKICRVWRKQKLYKQFMANAVMFQQMIDRHADECELLCA